MASRGIASKKAAAVAISQQRRSKRRSSVKPMPDDGRKICRARRGDGHQCIFRAKTDDGYCKRHDMKGQEDPKKVAERKQRIRSNALAIRWLGSRKSITDRSCPICQQQGLVVDVDHKYFGMFFAICTECAKRTNVIDYALQLGATSADLELGKVKASYDARDDIRQSKLVKDTLDAVLSNPMDDDKYVKELSARVKREVRSPSPRRSPGPR